MRFKFDLFCKKEKKIQPTKKTYLITGGVFFVCATIAVAVLYIVSSGKESQASSSGVENVSFENREVKEVNLEEILKNNSSAPIKEEIITQEVDLEYTTIYQNNSDLPKGKIQVLQEGRDGKQTVITKKTYQGDTLIKEEYSGNKVTKASIDKIVQVGVSEYTNTYQPKKGDILYVTSYTLGMMQEPNKEAQKITTLQKDVKVQLLEVKEKWYRISYESYIGWVDAQCVTSQQQIQKEEPNVPKGGQSSGNTDTKESSKQNLMAKLSPNMQLNKPSGLTLDQFKKVLSGNTQDKNKVLEQNATYFYYIEKQYQINGIFVASVGIHESNWGTSKIANAKKNLFGYGASDDAPFENAYSFSSYAQGIDLVARVFTKYYLNPAGTKIYDGQVASGKYYESPTLASVNKRYATDTNWNKAVYKYMQLLYGKI